MRDEWAWSSGWDARKTACQELAEQLSRYPPRSGAEKPPGFDVLSAAALLEVIETLGLDK